MSCGTSGCIVRPSIPFTHAGTRPPLTLPLNRYGTGVWPADVAAGIVGGAIAAARFGAGPYAYYNEPYEYGYP
jgi:hypothetical protein